jgi:hypothetical protein
MKIVKTIVMETVFQRSFFISPRNDKNFGIDGFILPLWLAFV